MVQWPYLVIAVWSVTLSVYDLKQRRLPNILTLGGAACSLVYLWVLGYSPLGALPPSALAAGLGAAVFLLPFYGFGWLGAGDVKLMSAIGFIGGVKVLLVTFVLGSLLTFPYALWLWVSARRRRENLESATRRIPQGAFLAAGLLLAMAGAGSG